MARLFRSPAAKDDLREIVRYIARDNETAARNWRRGMETTFHSLASQPFMGMERTEFSEPLRSFVHGNYVIFYRPIPDGVEIARVIHAARDYKQWL